MQVSSQQGAALSVDDQHFLSHLRALAILVIVFGHVGGFWMYRPYSEFLLVFVPIFFFLSGAVSFYSFLRAPNWGDYYIKRLVALLVPYYLLCLLSLAAFVWMQQRLPVFDWTSALKWLEIRPSNDLMPFPIGQVWFLNTLFWMILASPLYFLLLRQGFVWAALALLLSLGVSAAELMIPVDDYLAFVGNDLFLPAVHSAFFIFGAMAFTQGWLRQPWVLLALCLFCVLADVAVCQIFQLNPDYGVHLERPNLYFVLGSFAAIALALLLQRPFLSVIRAIPGMEVVLAFLHKHTFSVFLLHTLAIFLVEAWTGPVAEGDKTAVYGLVKLVEVLALTALLSVPFSAISTAVVSLLQGWLLKPAGSKTPSA